MSEQGDGESVPDTAAPPPTLVCGGGDSHSSYGSAAIGLEDGTELHDDIGNPILAELSRLANCSDLIATQRTIIAYETGDAPLFRFLDLVRKAGQLILNSDNADIEAAFSHLQKTLSVGNGKTRRKTPQIVANIKNIGIPIIPSVDSKFIGRVKSDALYLYKVLINFYFPNVSSPMKAQYSTVLNWAHENSVENFVSWIAGQHTISTGAQEVTRGGLKGAFLKIKSLQRDSETNNDYYSLDEIDKAFESTDKIVSIDKPGWINECVEDTGVPFMVLGRICGGELQIINYASSSPAYIKSIIKASSGSLFPIDMDYTKGNVSQKMASAIKNFVIFAEPLGLIIWQNTNGGTYLSPLYDDRESEDCPVNDLDDRRVRIASILDIFSIYGKDDLKLEQFEFPEAVDAEYDDNADIISIGYITTEIAKIKEFKGDVGSSFKWVGDETCMLEFMGALWVLGANSVVKKKAAIDKEAKNKKIQMALPYGYRYLVGCKFYEKYRLKYGERLSSDIDFTLARCVYKNWLSARKDAGIQPEPEHIVICVKGGEIGIWYQNVIMDGIISYDNNNSLVKIGTLPLTPTMKGQWRVPTNQLHKVWNLITGPWELFSPYYLEEINYHPEKTLDINRALEVMELEPYCEFGSMRNLCSTRNIDDGLIEIEIEYKDDMVADDKRMIDDSVTIETTVVRKCVPLVLRCGALWVYLYNETNAEGADIMLPASSA